MIMEGSEVPDLVSMQCHACRVDAPKVTDKELNVLMSKIPDWQPFSEGNILKLKRDYFFENFVDALSFTQKVGVLAESENHHPAIITEWGKCTVIWWTHKINGLHKNDFIMAAKTDVLMG